MHNTTRQAVEKDIPKNDLLKSAEFAYYFFRTEYTGYTERLPLIHANGY